jgi:general stress protein YciG
MSAIVAHEALHRQQGAAGPAFLVSPTQPAGSSAGIPDTAWKIHQRPLSPPARNRHPHNPTHPDIFSFDCFVSVSSDEVHLDYSHAMPPEKFTIQMPQVLFGAAGSALAIHVRVAHDRNAVQNAGSRGGTSSSSCLCPRPFIQLVYFGGHGFSYQSENL